MADKNDTTERHEGLVGAFGAALLMLLALFAMAAPDPVMGRHAPLQVEAVR